MKWDHFYSFFLCARAEADNPNQPAPTTMFALFVFLPACACVCVCFCTRFFISKFFLKVHIEMVIQISSTMSWIYLCEHYIQISFKTCSHRMTLEWLSKYKTYDHKRFVNCWRLPMLFFRFVVGNSLSTPTVSIHDDIWMAHVQIAWKMFVFVRSKAFKRK